MTKSKFALAVLCIAACGGSPEEPLQKPDTNKPDPLAAGGEWGLRADLIDNNSEFALAESNGKIYVLGGYPPAQGPDRTKRTVQVYDIASDSWTLGPPLPQPNNHGMAAGVNDKIYIIGGQTTDDQNGLTAVNAVHELDPATGAWVAKAPMPTARSGGVAVVHAGKIYVA
ncbi:MAG TPA: kelch repeat-containing protein [Gemmatimonas sp.]|nr:kelch repeat-containing protein [Gemmatimonas sp.]